MVAVRPMDEGLTDTVASAQCRPSPFGGGRSHKGGPNGRGAKTLPIIGINMLNIDREIFDRLVVLALEELPAWVQATLDNVEVTVAEVPSGAQLSRMGLRSKR